MYPFNSNAAIEACDYFIVVIHNDPFWYAKVLVHDQNTKLVAFAVTTSEAEYKEVMEEFEHDFPENPARSDG